MKLRVLLIFFSIIFLEGCNNWSENVVSPPLQTDKPAQYSYGLISDLTLPANTMVLTPVGSNKLAGTADGKFYLVANIFGNPVLKGFLPAPDTINCIFNYYDYSASPVKNYIFIGTNKGLYQSDVSGDNFMPVILKSSQTGEDIRITALEQIKVDNSNRYIINAYGWDGRNNKFTSRDNGASWEYSYIYRGKIQARINYICPKKTSTGIIASEIICSACEDNSGSYIFQTANVPDFKLPANTTINGFAFSNNRKTCFAATSDGLYKSVDNDNFSNIWSKSGLDCYYILSIVVSSTGTIFAGTDKGALRSTNDGTSWNQMDFSFNKETSWFFNESGNTYSIYITTAGKTYLGYDNVSTEVYAHAPILFYPENNSGNIPVNITLKWLPVSNINGTRYMLQISGDPGFPDGETDDIRVNEVFYSVRPALKNNTKYYWKVKAYSMFGSTDWTIPCSFTTQ